MAMQHFVFELDGRPHALARVDGTTGAERLVRGGEWENYPPLVAIVMSDDMNWDPVTADAAADIERELRSGSKVG